MKASGSGAFKPIHLQAPHIFKSVLLEDGGEVGFCHVIGEGALLPAFSPLVKLVLLALYYHRLGWQGESLKSKSSPFPDFL